MQPSRVLSICAVHSSTQQLLKLRGDFGDDVYAQALCREGQEGEGEA